MLEIEHLVRFRNLLLIFFYISISAKEYPNSKIHNFITQVTRLITNEEFVKSDSLCNYYIKNYGSEPIPYIYKSANLIMQNFTFNTSENQSIILRNFEIGIQLAKDKKWEHNQKWKYYTLGLAFGFWAYWEAIQENYIITLEYGNSSLDYFEKCLKYDENFAESKIAIATYDYWFSKKLSWLPFVKSNSKIAIWELEKAVAENSYSHNMGAISLFWIYKNENQLQKAKMLMEKQFNANHQSRYLIMSYANIYQKFDKMKSIELYFKALKMTNSKKEKNRINEITLRHKIAMLSTETGNWEQAKLQCKKIIAFKNITEHEEKNVGERIKKAKSILENIESKDKL